MILAFDTSSALTSVALVDGDLVIAERRHLDARRHAEVLAPLLADVLAGVSANDLRAIACGVGPGPYTGLRVGIASALAVGAAWSMPVVGVCSLDAIAMAAMDASTAAAGVGMLVASDARRKEVYWARYDADGTRVDGPRVSRPEDIGAELRAAAWTGHGAAMHAALFRQLMSADDEADPLSYPHAAWVARRAGRLLDAGATAQVADVPLDAHGQDSGATSRALAGAALLPPRPLYLRRPDAVVSGSTT